jgi:hypothetical protein
MTGQIFGVDLLDIIREDTEDFEEVHSEADSGKHDCTNYWKVYQHTETGTYYAIQFDSSYNDGIQEHSIHYCGQVEPVEVITTEYQVVKNG